MNEVKLKAALAHIGEGFYKLADAIESAPTTESEASEQLEPPLDEPETEAPKKKPAAKKKAVKKKATKKKATKKKVAKKKVTKKKKPAGK